MIGLLLFDTSQDLFVELKILSEPTIMVWVHLLLTFLCDVNFSPLSLRLQRSAFREGTPKKTIFFRT